MTRVSEGATRTASPRLRPFVASYGGYRLAGFEPGEHIGMPSPFLTVIVSIGPKLEIAKSPHQGACAFETLASGISAEPVTIAHDGNQHGLQLSFTPAGARALFGIPTAALGSWMVDLGDVLPGSGELLDRVSETEDWDARFDVVDEVLCRSLGERTMDPPVSEAWRQLVVAGGFARVNDVAQSIGWSRRHLIDRFVAEFGVTPKQSAMIARFHRSHQFLRRPVLPRLADVAAECGYYDQAHMAREWRDFAGMSPTQWRRHEKFAFVQDGDDEPAQTM